MAKAVTWLLRVALTSATALVLGFAVFLQAIDWQGTAAASRADAIVTLTGGEDRIEAAFGLLADGLGKRLLISGVNPQTSDRAIRSLAGARARLFDCCVDIGRIARDTIGNAEEAAAWVRAHGYRSLIVVTSSYHMPRSLIELERAMPQVDLIPVSVIPNSMKATAWWRSPGTARLLLLEYAKLLSSGARLVASRLIDRADPAKPEVMARASDD